MSEYNLFNKWRVKRKHFWLVVGLGIPLLCLVTFGILFLLSPSVGSVAYMAANTDDFGYAAGAPAYDFAEEMYYEEMEAESLEKYVLAITTNTKLEEAPAEFQSIFSLDSGCVGATLYRDFVKKELMTRLKKLEKKRAELLDAKF